MRDAACLARLYEMRIEPRQFTRMKAATRQPASYVLVAAPGLVLIALLLLAPVAWLFHHSFIGADQQFSLENYQRFARPIYVTTFLTTFKLATVVTLLTVLLGYPTAYMVFLLRRPWSILCIALVMLPFWTSTLARTYAWLVLLQNRGIINQLLLYFGIVDSPLRLVHNFTGTVIGMVHVMLPVMIFPLIAVMRRVDPDLCRASMSCGAGPWTTFRRVFFPLTLPGLYAGVVLIFVLSLGYYTTPALLGGGRVNMIANQIETDLSLYGDWSMASSLGVALVVLTVFALVAIYRTLRIENILPDR